MSFTSARSQSPVHQSSRYDDHVTSQKCFARISYASFQIQMSSGKMLHTRNFMLTYFKELEETLIVSMIASVIIAIICAHQSLLSLLIESVSKRNWYCYLVLRTS